MGVAKKRSARYLSDAKLVGRGGVWAARCRPKPINDRAHQVCVFGYIRDHRKRGAAVWSVDPKDQRLLARN
jgi:hypothetical protein